MTGSWRTLRFTGFMVPWLLAGSFAAQQATVADYCELTQKRMELSVLEWKERLAAAGETKGNLKALLARLDPIAARYREYQSKIHGHFGLSRQAYLRYSSDHKTEIQDYLKDHPEVRNAITALKSQIDALIQQYETDTADRRPRRPR